MNLFLIFMLYTMVTSIMVLSQELDIIDIKTDLLRRAFIILLAPGCFMAALIGSAFAYYEGHDIKTVKRELLLLFHDIKEVWDGE